MPVRIGSGVDLTNCPHCEQEFEAIYDVIDVALDWDELREQLGGYNLSFTEFGGNRLVLSPNCSSEAQSVIRWDPKDPIIESWNC